MANGRGPIYLMTDEEFAKMKQQENKASMLDNLLQASKSNKRFTTKNMHRNKPDSKLSISDSKGEEAILTTMSIPDKDDSVINISDDEWDGMLTYFDDISPIDDITNADMYNYRHGGNDGDEYSTMFKKETSMLNDVLSDLQKRSKIVDAKIKIMGGGKGTYGVSKNFSDLVAAATAMDTAKASIIKDIAGLKKSAADLRLKDKKLNPDADIDDRDEVADAFYKQIISGGTKNFVASSLAPYASLQGGIIGTGSSGSSMANNQQDNNELPFNITQPIPSQYDNSSYSDNNSWDKFGYISNENRNVQIEIYRYEDGSMKFVAVDEDGEVVRNYELPDPDLLETIRTKPTSPYAYDKYDRKYKINNITTSGVALDDLDDDKYDNVTDDDKYDY